MHNQSMNKKLAYIETAYIGHLTVPLYIDDSIKPAKLLPATPLMYEIWWDKEIVDESVFVFILGAVDHQQIWMMLPFETNISVHNQAMSVGAVPILKMPIKYCQMFRWDVLNQIAGFDLDQLIRSFVRNEDPSEKIQIAIADICRIKNTAYTYEQSPILPVLDQNRKIVVYNP